VEAWLAQLEATCGGREEANVDSLIDCVRCATWRQRLVPARTALSVGMQAAQQAELARRSRGEKPTLWVEFGAWSGASARVIRDAAFAINKTEGVHSFDSFEGLPEDWRADPQRRGAVTAKYLSRGAFSRRGEPPFHEAGVHWEIGWYNSTLGPFLRRFPATPISMVHIDCDLYSSSAAALEAIEHRLTPDAVIVFDELLNYPEYRDHEARAFIELIRRMRRDYSVLAAGPRLIMRNPHTLRRLLSLRRPCSRCAPPFGGTSNEDVAIRLLPPPSSLAQSSRLLDL